MVTSSCYRTLFQAFLLIYCTSVVVGQPVNKFVGDAVMAAPNAAALGKYVDIPVNYHTGVPNISIPIYTLSDGGLSLPVSLSYHASGIKAAERASWVGLGWMLNAGGAVMRTVVGVPDDNTSKYGYYHKGATLLSYDYTHASGVADGNRDGEPDLFTYNFGGYSGKFYFDKDRIPHFIPENDLLVQEYLQTDSTFGGFKITAPDGTKYFFGKDPNDTNLPEAIERMRRLDNSGFIFATSWQLVKIASHDDKQVITLEYDPETLTVIDQGSCFYHKTRSQLTECSDDGVICSGGISVPNNGIEMGIFGKRLKKITNKTTIIDFIASSADRADVNGRSLAKIQVKEGGGNLYCASFEFSYDYWSDPLAPDPNSPNAKRLKLTALSQTSCATGAPVTPGGTHTFEYEGASTLPFLHTKAIDHWGFFNGKTSNNNNQVNAPPTTVNNWTATIINYGQSNREPDGNFTKLGALKKINYPNGGYTRFELENNAYANYQAVDSTVTILINQLSSPTCAQTPCCNGLSPVQSATLTGPISDYYFDLTLTSSTSCNHQSSVEVTANGGSYSFTWSSSNGSTNGQYNIPLTQISSSFVSGQSYNFRVIGEYGIGKFTLKRKVYTYGYVDKPAGGLRIKRILQNPTQNVATEEVFSTFEYKNLNDPTKSSGFLVSAPSYGFTANIGGVYDSEVHSDLIVPMSDFLGYHIGYEYVTEIKPNNGKTVYGFIVTGNNNPYGQYPYPPILYNSKTTKKVLEEVFPENQTTSVSKTTTTWEVAMELYAPGVIFKAYKNEFACHAPASPYIMTVEYYHPLTSLRRVKTITTIQDGVQQVVTNTYHPNYAELIQEQSTVSDGKTYLTQHKYPFDITPTSDAVRTRLIAQNRVGMPIETVQKVNNVTVDGTKTAYSFFNGTTGLQTTTSSTTNPVYPWQFSRYEMTWVNGVETKNGATGWEVQGTIGKYDLAAGKAAEFTAANWPVESYEWQNGLIKKRTYQNFIWQYAYHTGTRLLASITDVDGQTEAFNYDPLMRLSSTAAKGGNVLSYHTYQYKNGTNPYSFIRTQTDFTPVTGSGLTSKVSTQYFDGLGRLLETVDKNRSPNSKDVVSAFEYDHQNRMTKKYNLFESSLSTGGFATVPAGTPFELTQYESTPLNREKTKTAPAGFPIYTTTYGANSNNEVYQNLSALTYFPPNTLYKTTVSVAQSSSVTLESLTYKDRQGRVILERKAQQGSVVNKADTYSEYDDKNRLVQIVPPGAAAGNALCFKYTYDWSDNLLTKVIPDKGVITMKYNTRDQLALDQDANLNSASQWRCSQYDNYGRIIKSGIFSGTVPATIDQTLTPTTPYLENTYDGTVAIEKGKIKTAKVRVLSASLPWTQITYAYDAFGRVTQTSGNNHLASVLGTEVNNFTAYDWAGNLLAENRITSNGAVSRTISQEHTYDHWGRLKTHKHLLGAPGSGSFTTISELNYDVLDRVKENNVGKAPGASQPLQSLDFSYNNNSWLTSINNVIISAYSTALISCPGTPVSPNPDPSGSSSVPDNNDLFYLGLFFNSLQTGLPGTAQSNGNIAQLVWRTRGRERQAYSLSYDFLDRMLEATYNDFSNANTTNNTLNAYREKLTYDPRGNITSLVRNGKYMPATCWENGQIDNLTYAITPTSNKLQSVTDAAPAASKTYGWNNTAGAAAGAVYGYDSQGNLNADPYKGITSIVYNKFLNLPETITFAGGKSIVLLYDASGRKLRKTVNVGGFYQYIQDYVNGIEYRTTLIKPITLESIAHSEGRVFNTNVTASTTAELLRYEYSIRDHLGNVRINYTDKNANGKVDVTNNSTTNEILQENHYYPFGMNMEGPWINDAALDNRYQYNGKEYNNDFGLNWNDYGARWYDATVGRWWSVDKLSDHPAQVNMSPYQYGWNNPAKLNDPDGNIPCPHCIAFVVGALIEYGTQVATNMANGHDFKSALTHDINGWKILTSGTASALSLGVSNGANTTRASVTVLKQLAVDGGESVAKQAIDGEGVTVVQTFTDVLGSQIGGSVSKSADFSVNAKPFQNDATRAAKNAANDPLSAGRQETAKKAKDLASTAKQVNNASVGVSEAVGETAENASQNAFNALSPTPAPSIVPNQMNPPRESTNVTIIRRDLRINN